MSKSRFSALLSLADYPFGYAFSLGQGASFANLVHLEKQ
jgi:hypothetical protein